MHQQLQTISYDRSKPDSAFFTDFQQVCINANREGYLSILMEAGLLMSLAFVNTGIKVCWLFISVANTTHYFYSVGCEFVATVTVNSSSDQIFLFEFLEGENETTLFRGIDC